MHCGNEARASSQAAEPQTPQLPWVSQTCLPSAHSHIGLQVHDSESPGVQWPTAGPPPEPVGPASTSSPGQEHFPHSEPELLHVWTPVVIPPRQAHSSVLPGSQTRLADSSSPPPHPTAASANTKYIALIRISLSRAVAHASHKLRYRPASSPTRVECRRRSSRR